MQVHIAWINYQIVPHNWIWVATNLTLQNTRHRQVLFSFSENLGHIDAMTVDVLTDIFHLFLKPFGSTFVQKPRTKI